MRNAAIIAQGICSNTELVRALASMAPGDPERDLSDVVAEFSASVAIKSAENIIRNFTNTAEYDQE